MEIQIKTTMRYHHIPVRMAKKKENNKKKKCQMMMRMQRNWIHSQIADGNVKYYSHSGKQFVRVSKNKTYNPAITP